MTIRGKLAAALTLAALVPYLCLALFIWISNQIQLERTGALALGQADAITHAIQQELHYAITEVQTWSVDGELVDFAMTCGRQPRERLAAAWESDRVLESDDSRHLRLLQHIVAPRFAEIILTDARGYVIAATGRTSDFGQGPEDHPPDGEPWWADARSLGLQVGQLAYDDSARTFAVDISAELRAGDAFAGVIKAVYDVESIIDAIDQGRVGQAGHAVLLDREGRVIAAPARFRSLARGQTLDLVAGNPGDSGLHAYGVEDVAWMSEALVATASTRQYPTMQWVGWRVAVLLPIDEALISVRQLAIWGGFTLIFVALCVLVTTLLLSRRMSRPLMDITRAVSAIDGGRLDVRVPHEGGDEVGTLAAAVNKMTGRLAHFEALNIEKIQQLNAELAESNEKLTILATQDELTRLANARNFWERLRHEVARAGRSGAPLSLVLIDLDRFKAINDEHGHPAGDAVLRAVGELLRASVRRTDLAARYGGEEMALILPDTDAPEAGVLMERLRARIESMSIPHDDQALRVTASLGVAQLSEAMQQDADLLFKAADRALYRAKKRGRNRVVVADAGGVPTN